VVAYVKVYRVYRYRGQNFIKLGGWAWQVFAFARSKYSARRRLDSLRSRLHSSAFLRVVKTNYGWAIVQLSRKAQHRVPAAALKTPR